jgi:hypothetical protein
MDLNVLDHVKRCYTSQDGAVVAALIRANFCQDNHVTVSFTGVGDVPSSFINTAFISLLDDFSYDFIRSHLSVIDSTRQINSLIKRRFDFELQRESAA